MRLLHLDFETRSTVDLRKTGVYKYAEHPDTGIWLASFAFDEDEPETWWIEGMPFVMNEPIVAGIPLVIAIHIADGGLVYAHNAEFERVMWRMGVKKYGWPEIKDEQWRDTAAEAAAMALPRHLAKVTEVLRLKEQKDNVGGRLMLQLSRPRSLDARGRPIWWTDVEKLTRLATYGLQDVRAERAVYHATRRLGTKELAIFQLDAKINDRGVRLDLELARAMRDLAAEEIDAQNQKLQDVTEGEVAGITKLNDLKDWLLARGVTNEKGERVESLDKAAIRDLLLRSDLPDDVTDALTARQDAAKSSIKKLDAMLAVAGSDERMRGLLLYHAAHTGRWGGRNVQPQNFPRGEVKYIESYIPMVLDRTLRDYLVPGSPDGRVALPGGVTSPLYLDPPQPKPSALTILSSMLRSTIIAGSGNELVVADYAAIEARGVAWVAQEKDLLDAFRAGRPIYKEMAAAIYQRPVEEIEKGTPEYTIGKAAILGAGFGMGWEKFQGMVLLQTGIAIEEKFAKHTIATYRETYPLVKHAWYATNDAAIRAVEHPGEIHTAGPVKFTFRGAYLWLILPSGRPLAYFAPKVVDRETPWGDVRPAVEITQQNQVTRQWERKALYGGLLVENIVQAIARDVLAEGMLAVEVARYPVVLQVHDEIVSEVPKEFGSVDEFVSIITRTPEWAPGFPLAAEGWRGERYRK